MDDEDISEHCNADIQESINCGQEEENKYGEAAMGNVENLDNIEFVDGDEDEVCHANAAVGWSSTEVMVMGRQSGLQTDRFMALDSTW